MTQSEEISLENLDELVERHMAFLIKTVSRITGRYVSIENDDEFSIALSAFAEAVRRYEPERGAFLAFAGLVIQSRLCTYLEKEQKQADTISLDSLLEQGQEFPEPEEDSQGQEILKEEISLFLQELSYFHLTLEDLAEHSPKHQDTKERAISIAEHSSQEPYVVNTTYRKKKLPVRDVARLCCTTEKVVKGSRYFILGVMLIFIKQFSMLLHWIRDGRQAHV